MLMPHFSMLSSSGDVVEMSNFLGKKYIALYFYPKNDTPWCTLEAKDFRDTKEQFDNLDCVIIGVSRDNVNSHCAFANKYSLNFILCFDEGSKVASDYGVLVEKSMFGKKYMGIERATFLLDKHGKLIREWRDVKVKGHVLEVLGTLRDVYE